MSCLSLFSSSKIIRQDINVSKEVSFCLLHLFWCPTFACEKSNIYYYKEGERTSWMLCDPTTQISIFFEFIKIISQLNDTTLNRLSQWYLHFLLNFSTILDEKSNKNGIARWFSLNCCIGANETLYHQLTAEHEHLCYYPSLFAYTFKSVPILYGRILSRKQVVW